MHLSIFHPLIQEWFDDRFAEPTQAQVEGWAAIASGGHALVAAPTGSGKTLAAFMLALDSLVRQSLDPVDGLSDGIQVVYVSPLKALANDIQVNLLDPLRQINDLAAAKGMELPEIRVAVRTGDTPQRERTLHARKPPHVLITTPESLFILLTTERGRAALRTTRTLILDELHAVAPNKRGSHLALSIERLQHLTAGPLVRIGLSATQRPIEQLAAFLGGDVSRDVQIVDLGHTRRMDLDVAVPLDLKLGPIATHEHWRMVLDQITDLVEHHKTTLVFVNTRRLVERVAHLLSERIGEDRVAAHHGSLSRDKRFQAEQQLKQGTVDVCVATASLELGIDIGDIDLVCLIGSPRNIAVTVQRIGRSGHSLGRVPKGRMFPLTRDELIETIALAKAIRHAALDAVTIPSWPLDVLAQQIVAASVNEAWSEDELFKMVTGAYSYQDLPRRQFDQVLSILAEGVASRWGRVSAYLHRDGVNGVIKGRRGARLAAITSGGAIPDTADYPVIAEPDGAVVGMVNEDFAIESMVGDVFLLGNAPWRITRVESASVRVESAIGQNPTIPFWTGDAPGRTIELSHEVSTVRRGIDERSGSNELAVSWVMEQAGVNQLAAEQAVEYITEGKIGLGVVPTCEKIVAERFFDEAGGMQLVIHAPFGARINRAWGLALRKRFCVGFNMELQASATDDGINIALGPQHSFPIEDVFRYLKSATAEEVLTQAVLQSPIFTIRWRWTVARGLALLRQTGGKRVPTAIQRMRSDDLLAAVFPDAAACQDNMPAGAKIELPEHPLVFEAMRDSLTDALDSSGMMSVIRGIEGGEIEVIGKDTVQPSAFSHQLLNAMPYAFLDDAPLEERRARSVSLRRALPSDSSEIGSLSPDAISQERINAWPTIRDPEELHDALLTLGVLEAPDPVRSLRDYTPLIQWYEDLARGGRVGVIAVDGRSFWYAKEREGIVRSAYDRSPGNHGGFQNVVTLVRGHAECSGPVTVQGMASVLALGEGTVASAVTTLEAEGLLLRGRFTSGFHDEEFCDRRILARIHRATMDQLRRSIEPVPVASYIRFLADWQHLSPDRQLSGVEGVLEVIEQLQGFEAAASVWEKEILAVRVRNFDASVLDSLCFSGDLVWGRFTHRSRSVPGTGLSRNGPLSLGLRGDLPWLMDPVVPGPMKGAVADVFNCLHEKGASFFDDIVACTRRMPSEVEAGLWRLVAAGAVSADGFQVLRGLVGGVSRKTRRESRFARKRFRNNLARRTGSRWALLNTGERDRIPEDELIDSRAGQLLRRYGIVMRQVLAREPGSPPWSKLIRSLRRAEQRGEIRGGRFVAGITGEQFALPEAVEQLRVVSRRVQNGEMIRVSACDPLNLIGILTPGLRVPAAPGHFVSYRDGTPVMQPGMGVGTIA